MGKAFKFVSSDVVDKVGILREFRRSEVGEKFATIEQMMVYEKENNLINYKDAPSSKVFCKHDHNSLFVLCLFG